MTTFRNVNLNTIKILIIGDRNFIQPALQIYLEAETDLEIIGQVDNETIALRAITKQLPDVIIIDSKIFAASGLNLTRRIGDRFCQSKILVLAHSYERQHIINSIQMGAKGYLLKGTPPRELVGAIRSLNWGYFQLGPGLLEMLTVSNQNTNFVEYVPNHNDNKLSYLFNEFKTEVIDDVQQQIDAKISENNQYLDNKLELKLHRLKIKQADRSLSLKKLERKIYLLFKLQIGFVIFFLIYGFFT